MTTSVRIEVTTNRTESGDWRFTMRCPDKNWSISRTVAAFSQEPHYPKPQLPCGEGCDHLLCTGSDAATVNRVLSQLATREIKGEVVERLGRYLFDTLLGLEWASIRRLADRLESGVVELALIWPCEQGGNSNGVSCAALAQLPWELMRDERNRNLAAAGDRVAITVTRVVGNANYPARRLSVPPKVLFVVGAALYDQSVRAGAEMLAVLREVRKAGCRIRYRILENTTPARLSAAMNAFRPDIVHFISHGQLKEGHGQLQLNSDEDKPELWSAGPLLENLRMGAEKDELPAIVVLSACDSAGKVIVGSRIAAPLAAELVYGGIPVVVAMAGTVSDRACRVFTRCFGQALADGESLVVATARARQRAFAETPTGADWALPAVFFSAAVAPSMVARSNDPAAKDIDTIADNARWTEIPVFCARENFLQVFWAMLGNGQPTGWEVNPGTRPSVLTVCAQKGQHGIGKTRLLEELARQALVNGHMPLVIGKQNKHYPLGDLRDLAKALASEMQLFGKKILKIDASRVGAELNRFGRRDPTTALGEDGDLSPYDEFAELTDCLEQDSGQLREAAMDRYPMLFSDESRVVVLIDEMKEESDTLLGQLFDHYNGLDIHGLGSARHPVPVVLVVLTDDTPGIRADLLSTTKAESWLVSRKLDNFHDDGEDMLAYELVMLNPWRDGENPELRQRWIFNREIEAIARVKHGKILLEGKPGYFADKRYEMFVSLGVLHHVLTEANDGFVPVSAVR